MKSYWIFDYRLLNGPRSMLVIPKLFFLCYLFPLLIRRDLMRMNDPLDVIIDLKTKEKELS